MPDLGQRLFRRHFFGQPIGPHLDPRGPHVLRQKNVLPGRLHLLAQLGLVGRMVFERAAQPHQLDFRVLEPLPDLPALFR